MPYGKLLERCDEIALLSATSALLSWDQEVNLPPKAAAYRARQSAYLSGKSHELWTAKEVGDWISECETLGWSPDDPKSANLREWRYDYDRATKLPTEFVERSKKVSSEGLLAWQSARAASDFSAFQPHLEELVEIAKEKADRFGYEASPYDALLDEYERGAKAAELDKVLSSLATEMKPILDAALERAESIPADLLEGPAPIAQQEAFNREVAEAIGFDFDAGRIDTAAHPFCSGMAPGDCRLTTRYDENFFASSLYGVLHEAGHGSYEQGLPEEEFGRPLGTAVSLGIHESQSRLWENHVGRSEAFWERWLPRAAHYFPHLAKLELDQVVAASNRASRSFIRVEADEMTYDLHIYLRFRIERDLIEGKLKVADVPEAWNSLFEEMMGLKVTDDANGCLQDIHWSMGGIGYFPTYSLGNLNASQLFAAATNSGVDPADYPALLNWMRTNIHQHGSRYLPSELIAKATGKPLHAADHLAHLRSRYL